MFKHSTNIYKHNRIAAVPQYMAMDLLFFDSIWIHLR